MTCIRGSPEPIVDVIMNDVPMKYLAFCVIADESFLVSFNASIFSKFFAYLEV
jgi:hypothetical protein